jgi:signal transduction histidine kinase
VNGIAKIDILTGGDSPLIGTDFFSSRSVLQSETLRTATQGSYYFLSVIYVATKRADAAESEDELNDSTLVIEQHKDDLKSYGVDNYFIGDGSVFVSNVDVNTNDKYPSEPKKFSDNHIAYSSYKDGKLESPYSTSLVSLKEEFLYYNDDIPSNITVYMSFSNDAIKEYAAQLKEGRAIVTENFIPVLSMLVTAFILFILLLVWTGRKRADGTRKIYALDNIFPEAQIIIMITIVTICAVAADGSSWRFPIQSGYNPTFIELAVIGAVVLVIATSLLWFLLSLVRGIKSGLIIKRSLIRLLICKPIWFILTTIKAGFDKRNPLSKTIFLVMILWLVTAFAALAGMAFSFDGGNDAVPFILLILVIVLLAALYFTSRWVKRYGELKKGVDEIAGGNLKYRVPVSSDSTNEFDNLSRKLNTIGSASDIAIQNELKNQRLKTDLISNVSHDLKTPLTSIITYTDLLKKEGLTSEHAEEYLKVIDEKSERLKKLTEDLFDAAKASSGAVPVQITRVDLLSLINQELAEFEQQLADSGLDVIVGAVQDHYYVKADSQLLWRVVDNLIGNVRKYALPGSRVYIDITEHRRPVRSNVNGNTPSGGDAIMTVMEMKNVSVARLNIPADELMERFQRGDESRATEGSGLGLAIAKDLMKLQNGFFEVSIDGDLFKVTTMLEPWQGHDDTEDSSELDNMSSRI